MVYIYILHLFCFPCLLQVVIQGCHVPPPTGSPPRGTRPQPCTPRHRPGSPHPHSLGNCQEASVVIPSRRFLPRVQACRPLLVDSILISTIFVCVLTYRYMHVILHHYIRCYIYCYDQSVLYNHEHYLLSFHPIRYIL